MQCFPLVALGLLVLLKVSNAAECAYSDLINADCDGHDIAYLQVNVEQCKEACDKNCQCKSIQAHNGGCWLKNYVCKDSELIRRGVKNYAQFTKKNPLDICKPVTCDYGNAINADCYGHDIKHYRLNPQQCQAECDKRCDCVSIQAHFGDCWIKNHVCTDAELTSRGKEGYAEWNKGKCTYAETRHVCAYSDLINADCDGHDIAYLQLNVEQCKDACDKNCECKSLQAHYGGCWLKNYVCKDSELIRRGVRNYAQFTKKNPFDICKPVKCDYGKAINADCFGHDIKHFRLNPRQCQAECDKRCDCVSIQAHFGDCWIKNHVCTDAELTSRGRAGYAEWNKGKCTYA